MPKNGKMVYERVYEINKPFCGEYCSTLIFYSIVAEKKIASWYVLSTDKKHLNISIVILTMKTMLHIISKYENIESQFLDVSLILCFFMIIGNWHFEK